VPPKDTATSMEPFMSSVSIKLPSPWGLQVLVVVVVAAAGAALASTSHVPTQAHLRVYLPIQHIYNVLYVEGSHKLSFKRWGTGACCTQHL
jgi:hypothetical protein